MNHVKPEFLNKVSTPKGSGILVTKDFLQCAGKTYITSAACMSVWSEGLSWANKNPLLSTCFPLEADNIVLLSCQVTDLAVLNDMRIAEELSNDFPGKRYFISGCLARRFDIELPWPWERMDSLREDYVDLQFTDMVHYRKPFWVPDFQEIADPMANGNLFRNSYPLRIGVGCKQNCKYCTIKWTRGAHYEMNNFDILEEQFKRHDDVVLIADAPTPFQIKAWCEIAKRNHKHISFRNVEPQVTVAAADALKDLAENGLLSVFHCPVQSIDPFVLAQMRRSEVFTGVAIAIMMKLKEKGTKIATNIIIDYLDAAGNIMPENFAYIYETFDYVSWNPYWDGTWNRESAEAKHQKYLVDKNFTIPGCPDEKVL